jgi:DNA-directed RNA polymerase subunit RPC12/RpoP
MAKLSCPDCGKELDTVTVERFFTKTFDVDYDGKALMERPDSPENGWSHDDTAYHCPNCDSLNVDDLFHTFSEKKWRWRCRYCEHLKNAAPPRAKYIGKCEFDLQPQSCGQYQPAACYEGHDPMKEQ